MNLALAAFGGYPVPTWESQEGAHTPSGSKTPIIICGWLLKMKREHRKFRSTWNRRWFTVEDGAFNWYKTSSSDACGRLSLLDIQSVRRYVGTEHGSYTFVVHATDREMLLRADSANDESRWIRGLTLQTDLVHGGTFQGPPSAKNRRRTVLKLMGEGCTGANVGDGRGDDSKTTGWHQKGDRGGGGGNSREGEWKGEGSQFREINKKIRALMNDHDNRAGGGGSSTGAAGDNSKPTRFYSERQPAQKFKITPRDPRGISIVGGRGLGKFPEKNGSGGGGGGGDNGTGLAGGGGGGGGGGTGDHGALSDTASSDEKDNVRGHWRSRSRVVGRRAGHEVSRGSGARRSKQHRYSAGGNGAGDGGGRHGSFSHRGTGKNAEGAGGRRDRNDFESLDDVSSSEESSSGQRSRRNGRNFDNDDFSRGDGDEEEEEVSVDRTNYWLQSGYAGGNGAAGYYAATAGCSGGGGGGGSGHSARGASGGSATAEDMSWNAGMMGGMSSRSRGSSRGNSGNGSSGRGGSGLPRRYLTEQSMLRQQGW
ncbi:conserved unknown protein [Ectocarpus siliculosus]|uniref:PH domain-containing protein n=1 Tax=Ectocarpus siliculosus TaxID=2880 RepID=D7FUR5_ECTSI|nr:conserved unknown protein [Ectocarpus siliculosus]|eukprot:CBJ31721.1 conserved unknown protein [Ectocarpus siliculosus]